MLYVQVHSVSLVIIKLFFSINITIEFFYIQVSMKTLVFPLSDSILQCGFCVNV